MAAHTESAAAPQLRRYVELYKTVLPVWTFPIVPFVVAAIAQTTAWFGGRFLSQFTLVPRVLVLWLFAGAEYLFMSPTMNAGVEVLGMQENSLIIMYNVATLIVFAVVSIFVFKNKYTWKHIVAFALLVAAVFLIHSD